MKILSTLLAAATLATALSPALAEPRNPNAELAPIEQALTRKAIVEGRQSTTVDQGRHDEIPLSGAERLIIDRNVSNH